jgi:predicted regulator of Ras-like GTPase activity (Roadblock/LC7/MglB family)
MDAQQALSDLTEISSQIQAAVVFDEAGRIAGSTVDDDRARALAEGAAQLLAEGEALRVSTAPLTQLEAATNEGSVFVVAADTTRIAATTAADPTVGLVFYDLKSALRSIVGEKPQAPDAPAPPKKKPAARKPPAKKPPPKKPPAPRKKPDAA